MGKRGCSADKDEVHPGKDKFQVWLPYGRHTGWCKAKEQEASSAKAWTPMLLYPTKTEREEARRTHRDMSRITSVT